MKSPFPGMDPYIEACGLWEDFHQDLLSEIKRSLAQAAPSRYLVRTGERAYLVVVENDEQAAHFFLPDVSVLGPARKRKPAKAALAAAPAVTAPVAMRAFISVEHRESFVEIYKDGPEQRLVTCVEVLSPTNKRPGTHGWDLYQRKRQSLMLGGVNLVELDLLRGGQRLPMVDAWPSSPFTLLVCRSAEAPVCQVWPASFRTALPRLPIPLAKPDADLQLDVQPMVEAVYERSRYERSIDYRQPLSPPLKAADAAWLARQLRSR